MKNLLRYIKFRRLRYLAKIKGFRRTLYQHLANVFVIALQNAKTDREFEVLMSQALWLDFYATSRNIWLK